MINKNLRQLGGLLKRTSFGKEIVERRAFHQLQKPTGFEWFSNNWNAGVYAVK